MNGARFSVLFGLTLTLIIAVLAQGLYQLPVPPFSIGDPARHPIDAMLLAIVIGIMLRNTVGLPALFGHGVQYSVVKLLPFAIVLMGARLDFFDLVRTSGHALAVSVGSCG